ncbi:cryptochrome-1b isoform X2, partial [Tachysurus ichikawai]
PNLCLFGVGFETEGLPSAVWPGGETEALTRLERHLERKAWVANFERPRMNANSLLASPTGLSPYLRFGCLSCRVFYFKLTDLYRKVKKNSAPPLSLYGQLLWREFFYTVATNSPRFDKMEGNPICVQIPWDRNPEALAKWAEGRTGFPWIDAIMTQLRQEGWIHHLARHAVACFLTRGDLWLSWEEGGKKVVSPMQEVGGAVGGVSLLRTGEAGEKELRGASGDSLEPSLCPREGPSTTECSVKALNTHTSPPTSPGSSENHSKADESLYRAAGSDVFSLPSLSTAPPAGSKQRRTTCST